MKKQGSASRAEAWIETMPRGRNPFTPSVALPRGGVD